MRVIKNFASGNWDVRESDGPFAGTTIDSFALRQLAERFLIREAVRRRRMSRQSFRGRERD